MPTYQQLLFGCANPRAGLTERNRMNEIERIWGWIEHLADTTGIVLDWPADTVLIGPLESDQLTEDDILGVVVAVSDEDARKHPQPVAPLFELQPKATGPTALAELCLPLSEDIRTALLKWEITRFSARGIGLDLAPGRLFLVEGWFDADDGENAASSVESADVQVAPALDRNADDSASS
jgi:hypothetical protein